jgi:hypothetical protein
VREWTGVAERLLGVAARLDGAIAVLATRQHGHVTRAQLLELGLSVHGIGYRVEISRLIPVYAGVYAVGHLPTAPVARAGGAVLACGPGAALSHGSAATLWGFRKRWQSPFEVTVRSDRRRRGIRIHRSRVLARSDVRLHLGVRVTSPARTALDIAPSLGDRALARVVNEARLAGYLRPDDLGELLGRCPTHRGAKRLRPFVESPGGPTRSEFEDAFVIFAQCFGFPRPEINVRVAGYEVDALFRSERLIVELDGFEYHRDRRSFERDRDRDVATLVAGFETVRVTWERLTLKADREATRLHAILRDRRN